MRLIHLLNQPDWKRNHRGFRILPKGRVTWTAVHMDNSGCERRRVRVQRRRVEGGFYTRYVSVQTEVELVPK